MTWEDVQDLDKSRTVAVLPMGAIEAHGPHLPLSTDNIIAEAMAREGGSRLVARGYNVLLLPTLPYTPAGFAAEFPGTISLGPRTASNLVADIARSLGRHGVRTMAVANAHLDPAHLEAVSAAAKVVESVGIALVFPNLTRAPWALRMTEEFKTGACHAGRYESSVVMAERPALVVEGIRRRLAPNPASLSQAIQKGKTTFQEAGGPDAYFGWPADASIGEGREVVEILGSILEEAVVEAMELP
jgi:creatinine amidohydrolase